MGERRIYEGMRYVDHKGRLVRNVHDRIINRRMDEARAKRNRRGYRSEYHASVPTPPDEAIIIPYTAVSLREGESLQIGGGLLGKTIFSYKDEGADQSLRIASIKPGDELHLRTSLWKTQPLITDIVDEVVHVYSAPPWLSEPQLDDVAMNYLCREDRAPLLDAVLFGEVFAVFVTKERR